MANSTSIHSAPIVHPAVRDTRRTSVTGISTERRSALLARRGKRRAGGFTLVEVLVVVLIISLLFGVAILSINPGSDNARLQREAQRLYQLLQLAHEESLLQAKQFGLRFGQQGYAFYELQEQQWQVVDGDKRLRERELPESIEAQIEIEGLQIVLEETPRADKPQIMMLSSGEVVPDFAIILRDRESDRAWRVGPTEELDFALELQTQ